MMRRRRFLIAAGVAGMGLAAWKWWPEDGWLNPCLGPLPADLANHELVQAAWEGIDARQVWDSHVHLAGIGDDSPGIRINPHMDSPWHPLQYLQKRF
jgi:mannonate dehydratase